MNVNEASDSNCYARALPTDGSNGGQAWGPKKQLAEKDAMFACQRYSRETGGNPNTCRIVESHCNNKVKPIARLLPDEPLEFVEE